MGKKRKFLEVSKPNKCPSCGQLQNENCPYCTNTTQQEPPVVQPAKRSFLQQILRHGLNVQTKANPAVATQNIAQKPNGLFQHFKIAKFKDGSNYIKGKEVETFLTDASVPAQAGSDTTIDSSTISQRSNSITDACALQNHTSARPPTSPGLSSTCESSPPLLRPLFFEVPSSSSHQTFIGRNWLFNDIEQILFSQASQKSSRGIIITGNEGVGKTSILLQLVENSCFGRNPNQISFSSSHLSVLASKLVAYHFCQVDYRTTCLVPEFVHSIAAQLCQAPQLLCYRNFLADNSAVQDYLSKLNCLMNPDEALMKGILEPLNFLYRSGNFQRTSFLLVIDSICEAEYHRTDSGDTISTFLAKHILRFPTWLKIILTTRSSQNDIASLIPFQEISLNGDLQSRDLLDYITLRTKQSPEIRSNISGSSTRGLERFQRYLHQSAKGNFLFAKLTLDFIEQGSIQIRSSNFKVLPQTLSDLFLLECNLRFPTLQDFQNMEPILSTCLAALNPLNLLEIYHSINSMHYSDNISWQEFIESMQSISSLLNPRSDGTYMFFHVSFREWLTRREESTESTRKNPYQCDTRLGHAAITFRLSRIEAPLCPEKTLELGHHILKAHIYRGFQPKNSRSIASRDLQAFWIANSAQDLSTSLAHPSNIYYTNFKVTRLLLKAGASPNQLTDLHKLAPLLSVAAADGKLELASLLLEFGADVDAVNLDGDTALQFASENGHLEMISLLVKNGGSLEHLNNDSQCAFVKAVLNSQSAVLELLVKLLEDPSAAVRRALVAICLQACSGLQLDILDNALKKITQDLSLNAPDGIFGETALTAAVRAGREDVVTVILSYGGNPGAPNLNGIPPMNLAAKGGHTSIVKSLLKAGSSPDSLDSHQRTALIEAVVEGQFEIVDLLVLEGADVKMEDSEGLNALSWACLKGHSEIAQYLLACEMDANHVDKLGRTPLDLACCFGSEEIAQLLLDHGALLERADSQDVRPLDRAVGSGHLGLVQFFLRAGAKINLTTWTMAAGKSVILLVLLNKYFDEGLALCKSGQIREAVHRFQYALKKVPLAVEGTGIGKMEESFRNYKINILLQLSRCQRILKEPVDAVNTASESIKLDPNSYKTWFARAKAYHCLRAFSEALRDCTRALELTSNPDAKKRLATFKENITRDSHGHRHGSSRFSLYEFSTNSLKFLKTAAVGTGADTLKPKASTSNCLSARKLRLA